MDLFRLILIHAAAILASGVGLLMIAVLVESLRLLVCATWQRSRAMKPGRNVAFRNEVSSFREATNLQT